MILVRNIRLPLSAGEPQAFEKALHTLRVPRSKVEHTGVAKLSVDARHGQPKLVYTVAVTLKEPAEEAAFAARCGDASLQQKVDFSVQNGIQPLAHRPVVCGLGPAGLFAALLAADLLLPALTEEKPKLWCCILAGAGMGSACYNIRKARRIREEKQNHEHDEEE